MATKQTRDARYGTAPGVNTSIVLLRATRYSLRLLDELDATVVRDGGDASRGGGSLPPIARIARVAAKHATPTPIAITTASVAFPVTDHIRALVPSYRGEWRWR